MKKFLLLTTILLTYFLPETTAQKVTGVDFDGRIVFRGAKRYMTKGEMETRMGKAISETQADTAGRVIMIPFFVDVPNLKPTSTQIPQFYWQGGQYDISLRDKDGKMLSIADSISVAKGYGADRYYVPRNALFWLNENSSILTTTDLSQSPRMSSPGPVHAQFLPNSTNDYTDIFNTSYYFISGGGPAPAWRPSWNFPGIPYNSIQGAALVGVSTALGVGTSNNSWWTIPVLLRSVGSFQVCMQEAPFETGTGSEADPNGYTCATHKHPDVWDALGIGQGTAVSGSSTLSAQRGSCAAGFTQMFLYVTPGYSNHILPPGAPAATPTASWVSNVSEGRPDYDRVEFQCGGVYLIEGAQVSLDNMKDSAYPDADYNFTGHIYSADVFKWQIQYKTISDPASSWTMITGSTVSTGSGNWTGAPFNGMTMTYTSENGTALGQANNSAQSNGDAYDISFTIPASIINSLDGYQIRLIAENSNGADTATETIRIKVSNSSDAKEHEKSTFIILPNPANDKVEISTTEDVKDIEIIDMNGSIVLKTQQKTFSVSGLKAGMYFVKIYTSNGVMVSKLQKT